MSQWHILLYRKRMEYMSPAGLSLKALICVYVCLLTCVNLGLSLTCGGATCGHGTNQTACNSERNCRCINQFSNRQQDTLFGEDVQYCLRWCNNDNPCSTNYVCTRQRCVCAVGYRRSVNGGCVDSCAIVSCGRGQDCSDTNNGASCITKSCEEGYQLLNNGTCKDINECLDMTKCDGNQNTICINTPGTFQCDCLEGYNRLDNNECKDTNECLDMTKCDDNQNTICINTPGSFQCDCLPGYNRTNNDECEDINECLDMTKCDGNQNTICINTPGTFQCDCLEGYNRLDNNECKDIDECLDKTTCDDKQNTICVNTPGSSQCYCLEGYYRSDNNECKDIDECLFDDGICEDKNNTVCVNTQGSFNCECLPGYSSDNSTSCQDKETAAERTEPNVTSSVWMYVGVAFGVLGLLGLVIGVIVIRKRRNSKEPCDRTAQTVESTKSEDEYENVCQGKETVRSHTEERKEAPEYEECCNGETPKQMNIKIIQSGIGCTEPEAEGFYSTPIEDSVLYNNINRSDDYQNAHAIISNKAFLDSKATKDVKSTDQHTAANRLIRDPQASNIDLTSYTTDNLQERNHYCSLDLNAGNGHNDDNNAYSGLVLTEGDANFKTPTTTTCELTKTVTIKMIE